MKDENKDARFDLTTDRLARLEQQVAELRKDIRRTRRTVWRTWFYTEVISPLIALGLIVGAIYYGITYIEENFLGGASILDEAQQVIKRLEQG